MGEADVGDGQRLTLTGCDDNELAATWWGQTTAPTILFLHGGGQTRHAWDATARRLAGRGWRTVVVDQRGHGESAWTEVYGGDAFAGDVIAMVRQLGGRPIVVGASLGGIAALLAQDIANQDLCRAMVLVDIAPRTSRAGVERILTFMKDGLAGFDSLEQAADAVAGYVRERERPKDVAGLRKNLRQRADGRWYWHWDPRAFEFEADDRRAAVARLEACASRVEIPVLLVRGGRSDVIEAEHVKEFQRLVPHAAFVDVGGAGHMVAGDRNDAFTDALIPFLDEQRSLTD